MNLLKKFVLLFLLATGTTSFIFSMENPSIIIPHAPPLTIVEAKKLYQDNAEKLQDAKDAIIKYYEEIGDDELTGFEREIDDICRNAHDYFYWIACYMPELMNAFGNDLRKPGVVIDVDETSLSNYEFAKSCGFGTQKGDAMQFRKDMKCVAIKPMRALCKELKHLGFGLIFVSSRRATLTEETRSNLVREDFDVDELILMPMDLYNDKVDAGAWKECLREKINEKYVIFACIGDSSSDVEGDYTGRKILFPNYIY